MYKTGSSEYKNHQISVELIVMAMREKPHDVSLLDSGGCQKSLTILDL